MHGIGAEVESAMRRRLWRLFGEDGRSVIIALDHGLFTTRLQGFTDPAALLKTICRAGADAILTTYGLALRYADAIAGCGLILRLDAATTIADHGFSACQQLFAPDVALRLGADAVAFMAFHQHPHEAEMIQRGAHIISEAHALGLPVMAEILPGGYEANPENSTSSALVAACRIGLEIGADFIKTRYAADDGFERVVAAAGVPVTILGGPRNERDLDLLRMVQQAVNAGAAGVALGRNVWQHPHPERMVAALRAVVHDGRTADEALQLLSEQVASR